MVYLQTEKGTFLFGKMPLYKYATTHSLYCILDFEQLPFLLLFIKFDCEVFKEFKRENGFC